ncbi:MAG: hypothetical protein ACD_4C00467G0004 [uncultured bacterium (gcode 4)]|uniref:Uncharacterized protein n=1 Tax=uncultured bacterium (gcode 4) TaxID=1234023 RepID=K2GRT3_9BACT|nr:MAG: hypothetical protein ACD_4C00467G0004 [uncultured bacterium (gcode 4)]
MNELNKISVSKTDAIGKFKILKDLWDKTADLISKILFDTLNEELNSDIWHSDKIKISPESYLKCFMVGNEVEITVDEAFKIWNDNLDKAKIVASIKNLIFLYQEESRKIKKEPKKTRKNWNQDKIKLPISLFKEIFWLDKNI